ncbi:MAG: NFACT RNA binding domain-containing protein [SAR324 cluster bacterium]
MMSGFPARGARIQSVRPGRRDEIVLETYESGAGLRRWEVSADREDARWLETFARGPGLPVPRASARHVRDRAVPEEARSGAAAAFALLARAHLEGGRVLDLRHPAPEIFRLDVETGEGPRSLVLELDRTRPELVLLLGDDTVLGSLRTRRDAGARPGRRALDPGAPYLVPAHPRPFAPEPARTPPAGADGAKKLDALWRERLAAHDLQRARTQAAKRIRQALRQLERRMEHLAGDRRAAEEAGRFRDWGELLKIHGARALREQPGVRALRVPDEFSPARAEVSIPVDPALPLAANIARLFREYRKRHASAQHVARRSAETEGALAAARSVAGKVEAAATAEQIELALTGLPFRGVRLREPPEAPPRARARNAWQELTRPGGARRQRALRGKAGAPRALERTSSDGFRILVGRSAADNDALTFKVARGRDWWLHALGFSGSHVVVRNDAGGPLPPATLREAAWLAGYYSKARRQGEVEVAYVQRKHVRRVPKGPPGQVTFAHGRTLWVNVGDAGLKRILDIQPEDESV